MIHMEDTGSRKSSQSDKKITTPPKTALEPLPRVAPVKGRVLTTEPDPPQNAAPDRPALFTTELYDVTGTQDGNRTLECPLSLMADSYKGTHLLMYPEAKEMSVYGTFRTPYAGMADDRIVVYGIKYYIKEFVSRRIGDKDIASGRAFLSKHLQPDITYKSPDGTEQWDYLSLLERNNNHFPVKIEALPEGSVIRPGIPVYIITATDENSRLCAFLETLLTMIWYPSTVATLSRHTKSVIEKAFKRSVDNETESEKTS